MADDNTSSGELNVNIESSVDDISRDLGFGKSEDNDTSMNDNNTVDDLPLEYTAHDEVISEKIDDKEPADPVTVREAPKSWAKEQHDRWAKLDPVTQDYIEHREKQMLDGLTQYGDDAKFGKPIREVVSPYMPMITARGLDAPRAIQALLNAQHQLDSNPKAGLMSIAKSYGINLSELAQEIGVQSTLDPTVKALQEEVAQLRSGFTARQQTEYNQNKAKTADEVNKFAADPKHIYFDECSEDIIAYINAGHTLEAAYDKAVYANPVTRAKELARIQTDSEANLRAKAKKEADAKRNGSRTNVNAKDTTRAPTVTRGNWEDTLNDTYKDILSRDQTH